MKIGYSYKSTDLVTFSNLSADCEECAKKATTSAAIVSCDVFGGKRRQTKKPVDGAASLYMCSGEDLKSSRMFWGRFEALGSVVAQLDLDRRKSRNLERSRAKRHIHNLIELNGKSIQAIYSAIPQEAFIKNSREELLNSVREHIKENTGESAKLIVDLLKNESLKKTELSVYNKILELEKPEILSYPLHKIVLLVLNSFWDELKEKDVHVHLGEFYGKTLVDFDALAAILTHLFGNSAKYIIPKTPLKISFLIDGEFIVIAFEMVSLRIGSHERLRIFEEGYSGDEPRRLKRDGDGLGLWVVRQLVESMGGSIQVKCDVDASARQFKLGFNYEKNVFELRLRKG